MRRICFDIGCNLFFRPEYGFINFPSQARVEAGLNFEKRPPRFDAATTFDSSTRKFKDFTDPKKLFNYLLKADEIISFNGRTYDLIVLESFIGEDAMWNLWRKPHHDLRGWQGYNKLESAVSKFLPKIATSFNKVESDRLVKLGKSIKNEFIAGKLANTYRDTRFTFALFRAYEKSGETEYTFRNDWMYLRGSEVIPS